MCVNYEKVSKDALFFFMFNLKLQENYIQYSSCEPKVENGFFTVIEVNRHRSISVGILSML